MICSPSMFSLPGNVSFSNEWFCSQQSICTHVNGIKYIPQKSTMWWVDVIIVNIYSMLCKKDRKKKKHNKASCPSFFGSNKVCGKGNIHHVGYELFSVCWMTGGDPSGIHHLSNWVISPLAGWERMKSDTSGVACREEGQSGCISFARNFGRTTAFIKLRLRMITNEDPGDLLRLSHASTAIHSDPFLLFYLFKHLPDICICKQNGIVFFYLNITWYFVNN